MRANACESKINSIKKQVKGQNMTINKFIHMQTDQFNREIQIVVIMQCVKTSEELMTSLAKWENINNIKEPDTDKNSNF